MFEYEKKIMLTRKEFLAIVSEAPKCVPLMPQTNYYFDDNNLSMNEKGITYRIREKEGAYKTTIKNHKAEHPDCSVEVDLGQKGEFDSSFFNMLGLCYKGNLVTERIVLYKDSCCEILVDKNDYLGYTDYELEIEYSKGNEESALMALENIAHYLVATGLTKCYDELVSRVGQSGSKSQRFFERLKICE